MIAAAFAASVGVVVGGFCLALVLGGGPSDSGTLDGFGSG